MQGIDAKDVQLTLPPHQIVGMGHPYSFLLNEAIDVCGRVVARSIMTKVSEVSLRARISLEHWVYGKEWVDVVGG